MKTFIQSCLFRKYNLPNKNRLSDKIKKKQEVCLILYTPCAFHEYILGRIEVYIAKCTKFIQGTGVVMW